MPLCMLGDNTLRHKILPDFRRFGHCRPLEGIEFFCGRVAEFFVDLTIRFDLLPFFILVDPIFRSKKSQNQFFGRF